jgi:hypothetical protein
MPPSAHWPQSRVIPDFAASSTQMGPPAMAVRNIAEVTALTLFAVTAR